MSPNPGIRSNKPKKRRPARLVAKMRKEHWYRVAKAIAYGKHFGNSRFLKYKTVLKIPTVDCCRKANTLVCICLPPTICVSDYRGLLQETPIQSILTPVAKSRYCDNICVGRNTFGNYIVVSTSFTRGQQEDDFRSGVDHASASVLKQDGLA